MRMPKFPPKIKRRPRSPLRETPEWRRFANKLDPDSPTCVTAGYADMELKGSILKAGKSVTSSFKQLMMRHIQEKGLEKQYARKAISRVTLRGKDGAPLCVWIGVKKLKGGKPIPSGYRLN